MEETTNIQYLEKHIIKSDIADTQNGNELKI